MSAGMGQGEINSSTNMFFSHHLSHECRRSSSAVGLWSGSTSSTYLTKAQSASGTSKRSPMKDSVIGTPVGASLGANLEISLCQVFGARARNDFGKGRIVQIERKNSRSFSSRVPPARPPMGWNSFAPGSIRREPIWTR